MKTVILCGGLGTRLREETEFLPKPMLEIGSKPILWHIMKIYAHYGFRDFIICIGYKGYRIKDFFYNYEISNSDFTVELGNPKRIDIYANHSEKGWRITLADTGKTALKGARIKKIEKYVDGDVFMLTYGDGLGNIDLNALVAFHKRHGKIGTVTGVRPPSRFGELVAKDNKVSSFIEKPQVSKGLINGGFFVFNREFFDYLSESNDCGFENNTLHQLIKKDQLMVYEHSGDWACMDTHREWQYLNRMWQEEKAHWKVWKD